MKALLQRWLQPWAIRIITKHLFNSVSANDILVIDRAGGMWAAGKRLSEDEVHLMKHDAAAFADSIIWNVLHTEVKYQMNQLLYTRSTTVEDMTAGKLGLKVLEIIDNKLTELSS